jgi:hypothetical protein
VQHLELAMLMCERALDVAATSALAAAAAAPGAVPQPGAPAVAGARPTGGVPEYLLRSLERVLAVYYPRRGAAGLAEVSWVPPHLTASGTPAGLGPQTAKRRSNIQVRPTVTHI